MNRLTCLVNCPHCQTRVLPLAERRCPACRRHVDEPPSEATPGQVAEAVYSDAAEQIMQGATPAEIQEMLTQRGLDADSAADVVGRLKQAQVEARKMAAKNRMFYGALWCIGGIVVTAWTYQAASNAGGGRYVIAWGAIVFGGIQFLRGLIQASGE